jgi:hypothetical protein
MALSTRENGRHLIYRFKVSGSSAKVVQTVTFLGGVRDEAFAIEGDTLIAGHRIRGDHDEYDTGFWRYPKGGVSHKRLSIYSEAYTISVAPSGSRIHK